MFYSVWLILLLFCNAKKKLPVKHLNCDIRAPWHVPREYECIGAHTMRYCAVQPCLHRTNSAMGSCENALTESTHTSHWKCTMHTLYFNPSVVHLSSWLKWGRPKAVWSAPSIVVCMLSLSCVQWLQRYIYIPRSKRTCTTGMVGVISMWYILNVIHQMLSLLHIRDGSF